MEIPGIFRLLFNYHRSKAKQSAMSKVSSLKTIKGANPKHISPRNQQAKRIVSEMLTDSGKTKAPEIKG